MVSTEEGIAAGQTIQALRRELEDRPIAKYLSDNDTEAIYALAYHTVVQRHFEQGARYFSLLTMFRPTVPKYLAGLALCQQALGKYAEAIGNFALAACLEPTNPAFMLSIAECELLSHDYDAAHDTLNTVVEYCSEVQGLETQHERAQGMLALLAQGAGSA